MHDGLSIVPLFAAIPEALVTLLIFVGFAIVNAFLKKKNAGEDDEADSEAPPPVPQRRRMNPSVPPAQPPARKIDWEGELRRMLGEEPPVAPTRPPPVVVAEPPRKPVRPAAAPPPITRASEGDDETGLNVPLPTLAESARAHERVSQLDDRVEARMRQRGAMTEASAAYHRASQLDVRVAEHMRQVTEGVSSFTKATRVTRGSADVDLAVSLIHGRESLRAAIIASVVLGPPKALEG